MQQAHTVKRPSPEASPYLLLSNVPKDTTSKQLRNLLTMMGPVVYIELWNGKKERHHPLVDETSCIVRFQTRLGGERCIYLLEKHNQYMMPKRALQVRKLTEEESAFYEKVFREKESKETVEEREGEETSHERDQKTSLECNQTPLQHNQTPLQLNRKRKAEPSEESKRQKIWTVSQQTHFN